MNIELRHLRYFVAVA
ncbi:hypothetical protein ACMWHW_13825, partial [Klebsiella pneumoniae]